MTEVLRNLTRDAVLAANVANMRGGLIRFRHLPGAEVYGGEDMQWTISDMPSPVFNSVIDARLAPEDVSGVIDAAKARCIQRHVPMMWHVAPTDRPADLGQYLEARGFEHLEDVPVMALDLVAMTDEWHDSPDLVIKQATDGEMARQ